MDKDNKIKELEAELKIAQLEKKILELQHENERLRDNKQPITWPQIDPYAPYVPYIPQTPWYSEPSTTGGYDHKDDRKIRVFLS
jgi:hypothetical protein